MVDGGVATDIDVLTWAAEIANRRFDGSLAERLAWSAVQAGAGHRALLARGEACFQLGRYDDAFAELTAIDHADLADEELARLAMLLAEAGFWGLGRAAGRKRPCGGSRRVSPAGRAPAGSRGARRSCSRSWTPRAQASSARDRRRPGCRRSRTLRVVTGAGGCLSFGGRPQAGWSCVSRCCPSCSRTSTNFNGGLGWVLADS